MPQLPELLLKQIRQELKANADEVICEKSQRISKEKLKCYGMKTATAAAIAKKAISELKQASKDQVFALCSQLWRSGYLEESYIACELAYEQRQYYTLEDFKLFESWIDQYVCNCPSCDTLCNHTIGSFVTMYPESVQNLKSWATSNNRWKRRGAAVTLIIPARNGLFLPDIFDIANRLITDDDDLVQKGYGWMLKAASEAHQEKVFSYLMDKKTMMPRTAFRYALEKMSKNLRAQAMKK